GTVARARRCCSYRPAARHRRARKNSTALWRLRRSTWVKTQRFRRKSEERADTAGDFKLKDRFPNRCATNFFGGGGRAGDPNAAVPQFPTPLSTPASLTK